MVVELVSRTLQVWGNRGSLDFCAWLQYQELREIEDAAIIN